MLDALQLTGGWKLHQFEIEMDGEMRPWGLSIAGLLIYTADGYVSVGINRNLNSTDFDPLNDSLFYAGTYSLDNDRITHQILVTTNPSRFGRQFARVGTLKDGALSLTGQSNEGRPFVLNWMR